MSLSGLCFDVNQSLKQDSHLFVLVHGANDTPVERLMTKVCWQIRLGQDLFRVETKIIGSEILTEEHHIEKIQNIQHGMNFPSGAAMPCPACGADAMFNLSGIQTLSGVPTRYMPLYDCSHCHTTRTITSLLVHNRQYILK